MVKIITKDACQMCKISSLSGLTLSKVVEIDSNTHLHIFLVIYILFFVYYSKRYHHVEY